MWISQNLWRDFVASYLGADMLNNAERYWDYQVMAGDNEQAALYLDTTPHNNLGFYPRGAVIFGAPVAAAGMRLNRVENELVLAPVRQTLCVPLLPLADWETMRVPTLTVSSREGVTIADVSERDLLKGLTVKVLNAEMAEA